MTDPIKTDILKWMNNRKYIRIGSDVSVTELIDAPQISHLRERHKPTIVKTDLNNEIPSLVGTGTHNILQGYLRTEGLVSGRWLIERHMTAVINGVRVVGKFDALRDLKHMYDIKVTRVWKYIYGGVAEFEKQLNMYDYMMYLDGYNIESLTIFMVILDWQEGKIWERGYPKERTLTLTMNKWSRKEQEDYVEDRVNKWYKAKNKPDNKLPTCTSDERWADAAVFKLYRLPTHKKAGNVFKTLTGAKSYQSVCQTNDPKKWSKSIIKSVRAQPWKRCQKWCNVSDYCEQYKNR